MRVFYLGLIFCSLILFGFFSAGIAFADITGISTCAQLQAMNNDLSEYYFLENNIDCSMTNPGDPDFDAGGTWADGKGFDPIGDVTGGTPFAGTLDGAGFVVLDLYINRPLESGVAPISYASGATIQDIGFIGGSVTGLNQVAGLVGQAITTTFTDVYSTLSVTGSAGDNGGLVGICSTCTITGSYATGDVSGTFEIGGLIGRSTGGIISTSYATGNVTGSSIRVGGFIGRNNSGSVTNAYATGNVVGTTNVGGFAGDGGTATLTNVYSIGTATGTANVGGLMGSTSGGTTTASFWDTTTSGTIISAAGTGKTTEEMKTQTTFSDAGWNFSTIWGIAESIVYPYFGFSPGMTVTESSGTTEVAESSSTDTFSVVLKASMSSDVVISVTSAGTDEATVSPATLTFTPATWNVAQTVTVTGADDSDDDGNQTTIITVSIVDASSEDTYDAVPDTTVSVITTDDDNPPGTGGGSSVTYGCKDPEALNYNYFVSHDQSLCEYASGDVCSNISGIQETVPSGFEQSGDTCTETVIDVCLNLNGVQEMVPEGYVKNSTGDCNEEIQNPVDSCLNINGIQETVPGGYLRSENGNCILQLIENPIDVCPNIPDTQETIAGYIVDANGNCNSSTIEEISENPTEEILKEGSRENVFQGFFPEKKNLYVPIENVVAGVAVAGVAITLAGIIPSLARSFNALLVFFGIRKRHRPWGTVYDSVTKQPLDPVYVSLIDSQGIEIASSITDIDGRYGFLVEPGTYRLVAKKTNYTFPSKELHGIFHDDLYSDLYFGDILQVTSHGQVIHNNIPMDRTGDDWNQIEKQKKNIASFFSKYDVVVIHLINILFGVGAVASLSIAIITPSVSNAVILGIYGTIGLLYIIGVHPKSSGVLLDTKGKPISFGFIRVYGSETHREIAHKMTDQFGKYFCLVPKGSYYMTVEKKLADGLYHAAYKSEPFDVVSGVINKKIEIGP